MDCEEEDNTDVPPAPGDDESRSAVNSLILDYYKKFGRKRDLEQYFSLSTAQSDIRDPSSLFWSRMKAETESSDSGERSDKKSESSQELCRISIRFPAQDPYISQEEDSKTKTESVSPPIIIEEVSQESRQNSDDEAMKSDDNNSQKSYDVMLDTSMNKPHSPSSSITSQRKLEWDSLADVGYANESDRKTSASSLSTLERLALKQQYSNNDTQQDSHLGLPTAQSTPLDENEVKPKSKKGVGKKSTKIYKKDIDFLEVNVPHSSHMNPPQSINVNLTKHISFNVEKDGKVTVENIQKDVNVSPDKVLVDAKGSPKIGMDKEIQTSLTKPKEPNIKVFENAQSQPQSQKIPILISLNTLRYRVRRKKLRMARRKLKSKKRSDKDNGQVQDKSGAPVSEAESFEYMPGHIYNQNQMTANEIGQPANTTDNKSSLESSGVITTDSSKGSKHSFVKDLEKSIDLLKTALQQHGDDSNLRKQLIKQICQRLVKSRYRDDDSTTDFLSGLSFSSKKLGLGERNNTTTSTSDANNSAESTKRPKKSILRTDKFNPEPIASTSQSVPNLPIASKSEKLVKSNLSKNFTSSNTDSDMSSKEKTSSDNMFIKTSSEELYQKYLLAKKREEAYKRHLKDKEIFLKQKLSTSDSAFKVPVRAEVKLRNNSSNRLKDLMHDLTRNNYDDGSGDASKLEGGPGSSRDFESFVPNKNQRSHSVFTLSSGNSDSKKPNLKKRLQCDLKDLSKPGPSKNNHYCCCPHHSDNFKLGVTDSSVQVNFKKPCSDEYCPATQNKPMQITPKQLQHSESPRNSARVISDNATGEIKYVCLCSNKVVQEVPDNFLIYKCSRLTNRGVQLEETPSKMNENFIPCNNQTCDKRNFEKDPSQVFISCNNQTCDKRNIEDIQSTSKGLTNKSSQTNMLIKMLSGDESSHSDTKKYFPKASDQINLGDVLSSQKSAICEATRYIQTEISINPKISDPTLSDINIVSDTDCAKLVCEQFRELKKPSLTEIMSDCKVKSKIGSESNPVSSKYSETSKDVDDKLQHDNFTETFKHKKDVTDSQKMNLDHAEKFTIPIEGTNMTLMVSIGSERKVSVVKKPEEAPTKAIGTDVINVLEQATSLTEECSKGIQSDKIAYDLNIIDHNSNKIGNDCQNIGTIHNNTKTPWINTCLTTEEPTFGTYPKKIPTNVRKPFKRSNTDTDPVENIVTDTFGTKNASVDDTSPTQIRTSSTCSCGCKGSKEKCRKNCKERMSTPRESKKALNKLSCEQTDKPNNKSKICSCGCGDLIENCKEGCVETKSKKQSLNSSFETEKYTQVDDGVYPVREVADELSIKSPKEDCKQLDKQISTEDKITCMESQECLCGCGGNKDNCKRGCNKQISPRGLSEKQVDSQISTLKDYPVKQSRKCMCGCKGTKDNCRHTCKELKSSPRGLCTKQLDKQVSTENDSTDEQSPSCSCGCGSTKDNCKMDCTKSSRNQHGKCSDKGISTETDFTYTQNQKCMCDCENTPDKCNTKCKEVEPSKQCKKRLDKQVSTESECTDQKSPLCSCGCGNTKGNCKNGCNKLASPKTESGKQLRNEIESNTESSSSKVVCGKKVDKQISTENYFSDEPRQNCPCGCRGTINNCKKKCSKRSKSPNDICRQTLFNLKEVGTQKDFKNKETTNFNDCQRNEEPILSLDGNKKPMHKTDSRGEQTNVKSSDNSQKTTSDADQTDTCSDPILNMIQNITKKYSKKDIEKNKRKKCFKEIMTVLNYLLETDESTDRNEDRRNICETTTTGDETDANEKAIDNPCCAGSKKISEQSSSDISKKYVDKGAQSSNRKSKSRTCITESSEMPTSTDVPGTSSDSATCKVLNKIKKECERYQKRCKIHGGKKGDGTSSTSVNCEQCKRFHHCSCRNHKCKGHRKSEKIQKNPVAYNLILQTSESIGSEEPKCETNRPLKNIIVKVPKKKPSECIPFKEMATKFERNMYCAMPSPTKDTRSCRSRSLPNESEISSMEEIIRKSQGATVREYLEKNRPDFIAKCSQRQSCLRYISDSRCEDPHGPPSLKMVVVHTPNCTGSCNTFRGGIPTLPMSCMSNQRFEPHVTMQTGLAKIANNRAFQRDLLSLHVAQQLPDVTDLEKDELRRLAKELGRHMRQKQPAPKFISEREMKKHSEKIYKSLPEVVQKKEELKKETIKKTNLLMANIFKRNLQKKTLRGSVNLSNYSTVIKI